MNPFRLDNMLMESFGALSVFSAIMPVFYDISMETSNNWSQIYNGIELFSTEQKCAVFKKD